MQLQQASEAANETVIYLLILIHMQWLHCATHCAALTQVEAAGQMSPPPCQHSEAAHLAGQNDREVLLLRVVHLQSALQARDSILREQQHSRNQRSSEHNSRGTVLITATVVAFSTHACHVTAVKPIHKKHKLAVYQLCSPASPLLLHKRACPN